MGVQFRDALRQMNLLPPPLPAAVEPTKVPVAAMPVFWSLLSQGESVEQARGRLLSMRWD